VFGFVFGELSWFVAELVQIGQDGSWFTDKGGGVGFVTRDKLERNCVFWGVAKRKRCRWQCWVCLNYALYSVTHPSFTSNVGPTAGIFPRYGDVIRVFEWVVISETDIRILVEVANSQQNRYSLFKTCVGNGSVSVYGRIWCSGRQWNYHFLVNTRPVQKVPALRSESALRRHWATQDRTVNQYLYLRAMRRLRIAVRRNGLEMAACLVASHNCTRPFP